MSPRHTVSIINPWTDTFTINAVSAVDARIIWSFRGFDFTVTYALFVEVALTLDVTQMSSTSLKVELSNFLGANFHLDYLQFNIIIVDDNAVTNTLGKSFTRHQFSSDFISDNTKTHGIAPTTQNHSAFIGISKFRHAFQVWDELF